MHFVYLDGSFSNGSKPSVLLGPGLSLNPLSLPYWRTLLPECFSQNFKECLFSTEQPNNVTEHALPSAAVLNRNLHLIVIDVCGRKFQTIAGKPAPSRATIFRMMKGEAKITLKRVKTIAANIRDWLGYEITVDDLSNPDLSHEMVEAKKKK